jgi:hypothetical protein
MTRRTRSAGGPARSTPAGPANGCWLRGASGATAWPLALVIRARTRAGAGERRCGASTGGAGRRRASSRPCGGAWPAARTAAIVNRQARTSRGLSRMRQPVGDTKSTLGHRAHLCARSPVIRRTIRESKMVLDDRQNHRFPGISGWGELSARVYSIGEVPGSSPGASLNQNLSICRAFMARMVRSRLDPHGE